MLKAIPYILILLCTPLWGQVYNVTHYTTQEGLVQSQVWAILQDHKGFLWLGTHGGLDKFDGNQFEHYSLEDSLTSDFITSLFQDKDLNIWIGTEQGIACYDGAKFFTPGRDSTGLDAYVFDIQEGPDKKIWVGTRQGLMVWDQNSWQLNPIPWENTPEIPAVQAIIPDLEGGMWLGTNKGLYRYESGKIALKIVPGIPRAIYIQCLLEDQNNQLWVGTDLGLYVWNWETGDLTHYNKFQGHLYNNTIYSLAEDEYGQIWVGTGNGGVIYAGGRLVSKGWGEGNTGKIRDLILDHEGNMWVGTDGGGMQKVIRGVFRTYNQRNGLTSKISKSFLEDNEGRIWISSVDQGIDVYDDNEVLRHFDQQDGLGGNDISYSLRDSQGNFWFASYSGGLTRYNGGFQVYNKANGLASNEIYCVHEVNPGEIWVGTADNGVSVLIDGKIAKTFNQASGFPDNTIYSIKKDSKNNIWIGTPTGVFRMKEGKILTFPPKERLSNSVFSILEDTKGRMWFATSNGLFFYDSDRFYFVRISGAQGAHNVVSLGLEQDSLMWIGTENGAYKLNLVNFRPDRKFPFEHYTLEDGLPSMECNANALFTDSQGNVWIGTNEGTALFPSGTVRQKRYRKPIIHIMGVRGGLEETKWEQEGFSVEPFTALPLELKLSHKDNSLAFEWVGISLKSPRQIEYKWKLEGLDTDWSPSTRSHSHSYALPSGAYTFQVVAKTEAEQWDYSEPASFSFEILPAYYQTWWFWMLVAGILSIIAWIVYRDITKKRKHKAEEIRIKNQAEKLQLEHQALYAMMNPHFTFNALQSIQYFVHSSDKIAANKFLSSFAKLIRKNLESTKSEFISLEEEVDRLRLYLSLEQMRFPEKFTYEVTVDPELDSQSIQIPPMIFQPFVENSIKHGIMPKGADGKIQVFISQEEEGYLKVEVRDNGIGVEASKLKKANRPSEHVSKGMQITQDRLALFARMTGKKHSLNIREIRDNGHVEGTLVELIVPLEVEI